MISHETKQRILDATRIEEVVGDFVSLKKRGANHIGCCPFHNEKTPSFYVSPSKGIFQCFGCGEAGDAVSFLMKHEHYTYPEALKWLAAKYNIAVEEEEMTPEAKEAKSERESLYNLTEFAQKWFVEILNHDETGQAVGLGYYHERGLTDEIIARFGLGYSPEAWQAFSDHALKSGYSKDMLEKTGLTIFKEDGKYYDRFRGRVTFPIYSISGRVLGWSCRILSKEKQAAKYVNSPDSAIYNKSHILYGLYQAKTAISKADKCYLVEGNLDVVSMHQSGVENTVASCGTSLTVEQVRLIKRYTQNVTIVYDSDAAGIKATQRAANMMFEEGMKVRCVLFPDGDDPDSYAQHNGSTALQKYLAEHEEHYMLYKARITNMDIRRDPIRKSELLQDIINTIALVPDLMERTEYIAQCANIFNIPEQAMATSVARAIRNQKQKQWKQQQEAQAGQEAQSAEGQSQPAAPTESAQQSPQEAESMARVEEILQEAQHNEHYEKHIMELLVRSGNEKIMWPVPTADGKEEECDWDVASVIVNVLRRDGIELENPVYKKICSIYEESLQHGTLPDSTFFTGLDDENVRNTAISLMIEPKELSPMWAEKGIGVPSERKRLQQDVKESLMSFRLRRLDQLLERNAKDLKEADDPELQMELMRERSVLMAQRLALGKDLRIVIG